MQRCTPLPLRYPSSSFDVVEKPTLNVLICSQRFEMGLDGCIDRIATRPLIAAAATGTDAAATAATLHNRHWNASSYRDGPLAALHGNKAPGDAHGANVAGVDDGLPPASLPDGRRLLVVLDGWTRLLAGRPCGLDRQ
jgi:hypothetical protein